MIILELELIDVDEQDVRETYFFEVNRKLTVEEHRRLLIEPVDKWSNCEDCTYDILLETAIDLLNEFGVNPKEYNTHHIRIRY